jgi:hypothetical protein
MTNTNTNLVNETTPALLTWLEGAQGTIDIYQHLHFPNQPRKVLVLEFGKRYVRVVSQEAFTKADCSKEIFGRSAWAFIDLTNGDVLKCAGWKSPAKVARGNIFDDKNGLRMITAYGPKYLR